MISIRSEIPDDVEAIGQVVVDAFTQSEFGHHGEADIVDSLRRDCNHLLSLVAVEGDDIVGHILFSPVSIQTRHGKVQGRGLAPMAVATHRQRAGIGTALVEDGLKRLSGDGCPFVVVLGHPQYYSRFGFDSASRYNISHGFDGIPQDVFFIKLLNQDIVKSIAGGSVHYRDEFGPQHDGT